jgi:anti-sigma regulatory factor (Ser/Thr protein kinase)
MAASSFTWMREGVDRARAEACAAANDPDALVVARPIAGGDYSSAGAGATEIKRMIKKLAIPPATARRVGIACFEAEVNVIVYADEGTITARVTPAYVAVAVCDRGPGIPDVGQAMQPGWTTATPEVREMGFGAGLGLPNIQQNSDYLRIDSEAGVGTTVSFVIFLE